ncbi:MAG: [protein-PII] uridylyltransferase [Rhodobiaceae bacterium]|nr:MAG: [protein-PII] uridylyltransferase [Rhodobiaceae bacterium]
MGRSLPSLLEIVDPSALRDALDAVAKEHAGNDLAMRQAMMDVLKKAQDDGRAMARERLEQGAHRGRACAENLSYLQDTIIRELFGFATRTQFRATNPTDAERLSVVATGGYGRGALAPGSDVDLLFLLPYKQTPWGESLAEFILYALWDLGLKVGHATRSIADCVRLSREDMTIRTSLLEARYICGDRDLFEDLEVTFDNDVVKGTGDEFVEAKLAERDERHDRSGKSRYLVEPNVKEGKGGLRDLHTLFWIAKYLYRVKKPADLVKAGVFTRAEYNVFRKAEDFLWAIRCELHFLTGRAEERISFDVQTEMAELLGYHEHRGLKGVERFMKHYFLVAKDVGDLTRILCSLLEEQERKKKPSIGKFMAVLRRKKEIQGFLVAGGRLSVKKDTFFKDDPVNILRIFHVADQHELHIHPSALQLVHRSLKLIDAKLRKDKEANRLFLEILTSRKDPETTLRKMNEAGVLGRFVPDFGRIVALMQFNMYHHYTADEHLIRAIGILSEIERGDLAEDYPLPHELMSKTTKRDVLYVAMFLHDIAKGRPEDHSEAGATIAMKLCPRLGMSAGDTETVTWLVKNHLVMSDIAQKRDLSDPKTIRDFAGIVQSPERLKLLLILTAADITAVGPGTWNGWKAQLLRELYLETSAVLSGETQVNREGRIAAAKEALTDLLPEWPKTRLESHLKRQPKSYWLAFDAPTHKRHAEAMWEGRDEALVVSTRPDTERAVTEITLYTQDHAGLFSRFAGACAAAGVTIVDAKIFTSRDGMALDTLWVQDDKKEALKEPRRLARLEEIIRQVLHGDILSPDAIEKRAKRQSLINAFTIASNVYIDNEASDEFTVIEVNGLDRPGLLHALTRTFFHLGLTIGSAHVATFGERAVDVFYVKDLIGQKVTNASKKRAVERQLLEALDNPMKKARPQKREPAAA